MASPVCGQKKNGTGNTCSALEPFHLFDLIMGFIFDLFCEPHSITYAMIGFSA